MKSMLKLSLVFGILSMVSVAFGADPQPSRRFSVSDAAHGVFNGSVVLGGDVVYSIDKDGMIFADNKKTGEVTKLRNSYSFQSLAWANDTLFGMKKGGTVWLWAPNPLRGETNFDRWIQVSGDSQTVRSIYAFDGMLVAVDYNSNVVRYETNPHQEKYEIYRSSYRDSKGRVVSSRIEYRDAKGKVLALRPSYLKGLTHFEPFVDVNGKRDAKLTFRDGTSNLLREGLAESRKLESFALYTTLERKQNAKVMLVFTRNRSYELDRFNLFKSDGAHPVSIWYSLRSWGRSQSPTLKLPADKVKGFVSLYGDPKSWDTETIRMFFREVVTTVSVGDNSWDLIDVR